MLLLALLLACTANAGRCIDFCMSDDSGEMRCECIQSGSGALLAKEGSTLSTGRFSRPPVPTFGPPAPAISDDDGPYENNLQVLPAPSDNVDE